MEKAGRKVLSNFIWRFMERIGAQMVSVIVSIILARILSTTDYGTVALMNIFINVLAVFINGGFSNALIQKKSADDLDFSSVFYAQLVVCVVLYCGLFIGAPLIASFYGKPELTNMIRVLGITLLVAGVKNVQIAYVTRKMMFRKFFFATLGGTIGAAFVGVSFALAGLGAWALIGQTLFNNTMDTIILWITVKWRPQRQFSFERLKGLFSYGWKILLSALVDTGYNEARSLLIGKVYSADDLAFYDKGRNWPHLIVNNVNASIDSVLLPAMSSEQDDRARVKMMTRRAIKTSTYVMAPLLIGLAACGEPLIRLVLGEKWLPAVPFQMIFCITFLFYPVHTANLNAIKAMGRSDLFLKLEVLKKSIGILLLIISVPMGVMYIACSLLITSFTSQIINTWPNRKLLGYGYFEQLKDIMPGILLAVFMGGAVYWFKLLPIGDVFILLIQVVVGAIIYLGFSKLFKLESFLFTLGVIKQLVKKA